MTAGYTEFEQLNQLPPAVLKSLVRSVFDTLPIDPEACSAEIDFQRKAALRLVARLQPTDAFEAMLAANITATHHHIIECLRRAMLPEVTEQQAAQYGKTAVSLSRSMIGIVRSMKRRRGAQWSGAVATQAPDFVDWPAVEHPDGPAPATQPQPAAEAAPPTQRSDPAARRAMLRLVPRDDPAVGT